MNNNELQTIVERISSQFFNRPFCHKALFNNKLRTTGGRYMLKSHNIEINPKQYQYYGEKALIDIIKHELCHYHLHILGKGYQHKNTDFKVLSKQVGAPRFCTPILTYEERANYVYQCKSCGCQYLRIKKVDVKKMRCGKCNGKLSLIKRIN
ncbi:SprT family protein [Staphylococcus borealis]|uniref:SprT family protein n=1 Tax=Staphylococcus borealis TaxID=2742203 RepID=UPI000FF48BB9|nr:SprT family protein [Staphylococcus borealis]MDM7882191.1 SprT family protein [Staphylococcus borealis]RIO88871.1 SprT family protein [Staphylococcus haemolyticus]